MKKKKPKTNTIKILIISALVLGFVFGYDDKSPVFELSYWLLNFIKLTFLSFISLLIFTYIPNLFSQRFACTTQYKLWTMKQFGLKPWWKLPKKIFGFKIHSIPLWFILPVLITLISQGAIYFVATMIFITKINPAYRVGKTFTKLTEYENAKLALISPIAAILIAVILKIIFPAFTELILINSMLAISYMVPLPKLNGATIFFGSKILYTLSLVFILLTVLLLKFLDPLITVLIAAFFALIITITYMIKVYSVK